MKDKEFTSTFLKFLAHDGKIQKEYNRKVWRWRIFGMIQLAAELTLVLIDWRIGTLVVIIVVTNNHGRNQSR